MRAPPSPTAVQLREIPAEGLRRSYDLGGDFAERALEGTEVAARNSAVNADVEMWKSGVEVLARGKINGELATVCSRCAGPARVAIESPFEVLFLPRGGEVPDAGDEDALDQPDVVSYDDDEIDLGETMREELLIALPLAPLCREDCKGLCARCGKDLNEGPCACPEEPRDDRWSALRTLKLD